TLRLVHGALLVLAGSLNVEEGAERVLGRAHVLHVDLEDLDASTVIVEDLLDELLRLARDRRAPLGVGDLEVALADDLAHRRLGDVLHGTFGIADVEEEEARVLDDPLHRELDVDDVLVASEHLAFLIDVARERLPAGIARPASEADFHLVHARDLGREHMPDRCRQVIVQARRGRIDPLAEDHRNPLLLRLHPINTGRKPQDQGTADEQCDDPRIAPAAAGQEPAQHILEFADDIFEIGLLRRRWTAAPRTASALIAPRHTMFLQRSDRPDVAAERNTFQTSQMALYDSR